MRPDIILGKTVRSIQRYQNWAEIMISTAKKQYPAKVILRNGTRFEAAEAFSWLVDEIFFEHVYTPDHLQIETNDIVVDIGAHSGVFTVFAALMTQNTVYAYEPFPHNFAALKRNIDVNKLSNAIPQGYAVSDKVGLAALLVSAQRSTQHLLSDRIAMEKLERYQAGADHLQVKNIMPATLEEFIEVPTTTLQEIMDSNNIEQIGFLKLDCEGAEGAILATTPKNHLKRVRKIAIEFHDHLSKMGHDDMRKLLENADFTTELRWDGDSPLGYLYAWRDSLSDKIDK